jgi:hypothetical protein
MPVNRQGRSQKPPEQNLEQHWLPAVQRDPVGPQRAAAMASVAPLACGLQVDGDPMQLKLQHSASCPHENPSPRHGVWQM